MTSYIRQTSDMKRQVRQIQRWLSTHEYESGYGIRLYSSGLHDEYGRLLALSRRGVVVAFGGGCITAKWTDFTLPQLRKIFTAAKRKSLVNNA